jgi:hypothetical protein
MATWSASETAATNSKEEESSREDEPCLARVEGTMLEEDHAGPLETRRPRWEQATQ